MKFADITKCKETWILSENKHQTLTSESPCFLVFFFFFLSKTLTLDSRISFHFLVPAKVLDSLSLRMHPVLYNIAPK